MDEATKALNHRKASMEKNNVDNMAAGYNVSIGIVPIETDISPTQNTEMTVVVNSSTRPGTSISMSGMPSSSQYPSQALLPPPSSAVNQVAANNNPSNTSVSKRDSNSTTIMLIVIVSVFLLLEIPLTITTILHVLQNTFPILWVDYNTLNTIILITNFCIICINPINFAIYCGMSRQFRQTFSELFIYGVLGKRRTSAIIMGARERETNAITGASSSTFGVTSKSLTMSMTVPETITDQASSANNHHNRSPMSLNNASNRANQLMAAAAAAAENCGNGSSDGKIKKCAKMVKLGSPEYIDDDEVKVLETEL